MYILSTINNIVNIKQISESSDFSSNQVWISINTLQYKWSVHYMYILNAHHFNLFVSLRWQIFKNVLFKGILYIYKVGRK